MKINNQFKTLVGGLLISLTFFGQAIAENYFDHMGTSFSPMGMMGMDSPMGGRGMMGRHMGFGMLSTVDLTTEQEKKINKLHDTMRKDHWKTMGLIMDLQTKLNDTILLDTPDPKSVGKIYEEISQLKKKMLEDRVAAMNKVRQLLTNEQQKQLNSGKRRYSQNRGSMMRHNWRYSMDD